LWQCFLHFRTVSKENKFELFVNVAFKVYNNAYLESYARITSGCTGVGGRANFETTSFTANPVILSVSQPSLIPWATRTLTLLHSVTYTGKDDLEKILDLVVSVRPPNRLTGTFGLGGSAGQDAAMAPCDAHHRCHSLVDPYNNLRFEVRWDSASLDLESQIVDWGIRCIRMYGSKYNILQSIMNAPNST
jgi:hypothetical protein